MISAPALANHLQATLHTPDIRVLGVRHRAKDYQPAITVLDVTTPDQLRPVAPALDYWHNLKNTYHMSQFALWDTYQVSTPTRGNIISSIMLVEGKRVDVQWQSNLTYVEVKRVEQANIEFLVIPRERAIVLIAA